MIIRIFLTKCSTLAERTLINVSLDCKPRIFNFYSVFIFLWKGSENLALF